MISDTTSFRAVVFLILGFFGLVSFAEAEQSISIAASARLTQTKHVLVHFVLKNNADAPIQIRQSELPWDSHATGVVAYLGRGGLGHTLHRWYTVQDTGPNRVTVQPKAEVSGDMDLNLSYPDLEKVQDFGDLVLFWVYRPQSSEQQPQFGGMLLVSP